MHVTYDRDAAVAHLRAVDPRLRWVIDRAGPLRLRDGGAPYPALIRSILYQQLAGPAAAAIERRFLALFGDAGQPPDPARLLATDVETLRRAGVSRQKAGYLLDLAARAHEGVIGDELSDLADDEVAHRVMLVKGVGRWTADMLLIFSLGRPDILPVGDLGIKNAVTKLYGHPEHLPPAALVDLAEPWRPYRSAASWYLWRFLDLKLADPM